MMIPRACVPRALGSLVMPVTCKSRLLKRKPVTCALSSTKTLKLTQYSSCMFVLHDYPTVSPTSEPVSASTQGGQLALLRIFHVWAACHAPSRRSRGPRDTQGMAVSLKPNKDGSSNLQTLRNRFQVLDVSLNDLDDLAGPFPWQCHLIVEQSIHYLIGGRA